LRKSKTLKKVGLDTKEILDLDCRDPQAYILVETSRQIRLLLTQYKKLSFNIPANEKRCPETILRTTEWEP
jgi:hypothetical protein